MPVLITMPALSPTMEKGNLVKWCRKEGDEISVGDVICEIDTDKATMEVEALYKGILAKIVVNEGTRDVLVKTPIAILRQKNDSDSDVESMAQELEKNTGKISEKCDIISKSESCKKETEILQQDDFCEKIKISPLAKKIANEYGINLKDLKGSGPMGRIVKDDVLKFKNDNNRFNNKEFERKNDEYSDTEPSTLRRVIAEKLTKVKQEVPHFYMQLSCNVDEIMNAVKTLNTSDDPSKKITVNDVIIKAVALSIKNNPAINVSWINGKIRKYNNVDVSVAVSVDGGIFTPVIKNADIKSLSEISAEMKELAKKARSGNLSSEEYSGGSITLSNLGMTDVELFFSIINPPQGSILSIGRAAKKPVVNNKDEIIVSKVIELGYAVDHRVIDGKDAGIFLGCIKKYLENPLSMLFS